MEKPYKDITTLCFEKYGKKLYRLSLSLATTCPNRDGKISTGGCIFCSAGGSGDFAENSCNINEQIEKAKLRVNKKIKGDVGYIAYFQSYTTTYVEPQKLKDALFTAASREDISAVSVATRPDCLGEEIIEILKEVQKIKPLWVELGLQTSDENTAKLINRGYNLSVFNEAVNKLSAFANEIIAHIIIGLPNETEKELYATIAHINSLPVTGVKLQLLHVLKNTALAKMDYTALSLEEYAYLLGSCIERLREDITIHRITGDGPKKELIAPLWSGNKKAVLNYLTKYFKENNINQGKNYLAF